MKFYSIILTLLIVTAFILPSGQSLPKVLYVQS